MTLLAGWVFIGLTGAYGASAGRRISPATDAPGSANRKGESTHMPLLALVLATAALGAEPP